MGPFPTQWFLMCRLLEKKTALDNCFKSYQYIAVQCMHHHINETISPLNYTNVLNMCMDKRKKSFLSLLLGNANITKQNSVMEFLKQVFIAFCCYVYFSCCSLKLTDFVKHWIGHISQQGSFYVLLCLFVCLRASLIVSAEFLERVFF